MIAARTGSDQAVVRRFLHQMFAQIEEGLSAGEKVIIRGIGEFVPYDDSASPVKFLADPELAAIANEPFAAFEAVELNDGVTESILGQADTTEEISDETTVSTILPERSPISDSEPEPADEQERAVEAVPMLESEAKHEAEHEAEPEYVSAPKPAPEPESEPAYEPASVPEPESESESESEPESESESESESQHAPMPAPEYEPEPEPEPEPHPVREYYSHRYSDDEGNGGSSTSHKLWLVLGALCGLIIGVVGGYFAGKHLGQYHTDGGMASTDTTTIDIGEFEPIVPVAEPVEEQQETVQPPTDPATATAGPVSEPSATPSSSSAASEVTAPTEPVYDTVTKSRYLTTMARDHYGKKSYWIFIYNANPQLNNPNQISPGTRVVIPAKSSFAGATEAETDAKAQKLLNELSRKYKL